MDLDMKRHKHATVTHINAAAIIRISTHSRIHICKDTIINTHMFISIIICVCVCVCVCVWDWHWGLSCCAVRILNITAFHIHITWIIYSTSGQCCAYCVCMYFVCVCVCVCVCVWVWHNAVYLQTSALCSCTWFNTDVYTMYNVLPHTQTHTHGCMNYAHVQIAAYKYTFYCFTSHATLTAVVLKHFIL